MEEGDNAFEEPLLVPSYAAFERRIGEVCRGWFVGPGEYDGGGT